eukprot:CAMPEP_0173372878 /NCGR_PEP_ID=MMETSP1144-20121109/28170_1 /TAXON_ID=483371 /ORGANISM="non described non described, Strain CCMP2298" /LENGTH=694 /DNA_ID=CAMNT_0014324957 /DNA_START=39 /DNA_END=2125 /DNA_ORIENTATION=+
MSFVLGDVMVTWTAGLSNGFPSYMVAKFTFGTAFICLTLCQAEMTSMLPFSGGSYGFARVTLGPFVGFIVGYMEALSNFMFTVEVAEHFGYLVQIMMGSTSQLRPVYWLFFYIPAVSLLVSGSKYFYPVTAGLAVFSRPVYWLFFYIPAVSLLVSGSKYFYPVTAGLAVFSRPVYWLFFYIPAVSLLVSGSKYFYPVTAGLAVFSLTVIAVYLLGTSPDTDFMQYVVNSDDREIFPGGAGSIMKVLHISAQLWLGVQSVTLACEDTDDATMVVPKAMLSGVVVVFLLSFLITLSISSQYPGVVEVEHTQAPMSYGLAHMLNIPRAAASIFSLFAVFGVGLTHMFAYSRQIMALARSRFQAHNGFQRRPCSGNLVWGSGELQPESSGGGGFENEVHILLRTSRLFNFIGYLIVFASFLVFKISFSSMQRNFTNPIGYFSVAYGASIFLLAMLGILVFEEGQDISKGVCAGSLAAMFLYYYFVASKAQTYSKEEQHLLLKLYVIKGHVQKRKHKGKKTAATVASTAVKVNRNKGSKGSSSGSGSGGSDQESDVGTFQGTQLEGTQDAPEPIAEEVQQEQEDEDGSGRLSFAGNAVKNMKLITRDALAPFSPSFDASPEVHPLPITPSLSIETGHSKREDKPPAEEDDAIRSMYFPVSTPGEPIDGSIQSDVKGRGQRSTSDAALLSIREDELRLAV